MLLSEVMALQNKVDKIVTSAPEWKVSDALDVCISSFFTVLFINDDPHR